MDDLLPLSAVAFTPPFPNAAVTDAEGELMWVELGDLFIDPKYQRPISANGEKNIRQVIENFSWSLFSPIVICKRERGKYAIIDGQHRAIAALTHGGIAKVPALCINGTAHDEAKAFSVINGAVTAITPSQLWYARVIAGDQNTVLLDRLLNELGIRILRSTLPENKMKAGDTSAIVALEKFYKKFKAGVLTNALKWVMLTGKGNPGYLRGPIIQAHCEILAEHPEWYARQEDLMTAIRSVGIKYLWAMAAQSRQHKKRTQKDAYKDELIKLFGKLI